MSQKQNYIYNVSQKTPIFNKRTAYRCRCTVGILNQNHLIVFVIKYMMFNTEFDPFMKQMFTQGSFDGVVQND